MICPRPHGLYHFAPVGERGSRLAGSPWTIYGPWHQSSGPGAQRSALPGSSLARSSTQSSSRTLRVLGSSVPRGGAVALILAYRVERTLAHLHCGCAELTGVRVPVFVFPVFTAHGPQALLLGSCRFRPTVFPLIPVVVVGPSPDPLLYSCLPTKT